jgi:hypothetical protein
MVIETNQKTEWLENLRASSSRFMRTLRTFLPEEINKVPYPGSWTAGQVAEHVHKSDQGMIFLLNGTTREADRDPAEKQEALKQVFLDFHTKMQSPERIIPENKEYDKAAILARFENDRAAMRDLLAGADWSVICTSYPFPNFGEISKLELISFVVYHTKRHIFQLEKIAQLVQG